MKRLSRLFPALALIPLALPAAPDRAPDLEGPLAPFERLAGKWRGEDPSAYHEYDWGIEGKTFHGRSYAVTDAGPLLQADGMWFWHPGDKQIKGITSAVNMPFEVLEFTTVFHDDVFTAELTSIGADGSTASFVETITLVDDDHFDWSLSVPTENGPRPMMETRYTRVKEQ